MNQKPGGRSSLTIVLWLFWLGLVISGLLAVRYMFSADRRAEGLPTPPPVYENVGEVDDFQLGPTHLRDDVWIVYSSESIARFDRTRAARSAWPGGAWWTVATRSTRWPATLGTTSKVRRCRGAARPLHLGLPTPRGCLRLFPRHRRQRMSQVRTSPSSALESFSSTRRRLLAMYRYWHGADAIQQLVGGRRTAAKTRSRSLDPDWGGDVHDVRVLHLWSVSPDVIPPSNLRICSWTQGDSNP